MDAPWTLFLQVPLALAGKDVDLPLMEKALKRIKRRGWVRLDSLKSFNERGPDAFWLDTILTACELLIRNGRTGGPAKDLLVVFADQSFRQIDDIQTFHTSLIDLLLRARALLLRMEGKSLTGEEFLIEPPTPEEQATRAVSTPMSRHREEVRRFLGPFFPLYNARAQVLCSACGDPVPQLISAIDSLEHDDASLRRMSGSFDLRKRAAVAMASLRILGDIDVATALKQSLRIFGKARDIFGSDEMAILDVLVLNPDAHAAAVEMLSTRAKVIVQQSVRAREKVRALLVLSRFAARISPADASAFFRLAHAATEEMDIEGTHMLRAVAAMACHGANALDQISRRSAASQLYSIVTEASVRLSDSEGFPWSGSIQALSALDPVIGLAAIARWQDSARLDLDTSLGAFIPFALAEGRISPALAAGLLPLVGTDAERLLDRISARLTDVPEDDARREVIEQIAQQAVRVPRGANKAVSEALKRSLPQGAPAGPWLLRLSTLSVFLEDLRRADAATPEDDSAEAQPPSSLVPVIGIPLASVGPQQITDAVEAEIAAWRAAKDGTAGAAGYISPDDILENIRIAVPVSERTNYLEALSSARSEGVRDASVARALYRAIEEWRNTLGVREWCRDRLPTAIIERFPGFCTELTFRPEPVLISFLNLLQAEGVDSASVLVEAIGRHVEKLNSTILYELARVLTRFLPSADVGQALGAQLPLLVQRIAPSNLDSMPTAQMPDDGPSAIARFLFALMSDCDVRIRWRAAHSFRYLARAGTRDVVAAFLDEYDRQTEETFRAPREPFYWIAARLSWTVAVCRVAHECPAAVASYGPKLLSMATDATFPHVLIREFAKDGARTLAAAGVLKLTPAQRRQLSKANTGRGPRRHGTRSYKSPVSKHAKRHFDFDPVDTIPYWYQPALGMFADVTQEEFLDVAEKWIVKNWKVVDNPSRWRNESRGYRFSERNWKASSNDHGGDPVLERLPTYLEKHAMFCAIGELIESRALVHRHDEPEDQFETWLQREGLEFPPLWLADFRAPVPTEARFWGEPKSIGTWIDQISDEDFLCELGREVRADMIVVDGWHETGAVKFSSQTSIASALVEPSTAPALVRAFQSADDPHDYKLPDEDEEQFEINEPPYRLRGWLRDLQPWHSGIDQLDPLRMSVRGATVSPGPFLARSLSKESAPEGWPIWRSKDKRTIFEFEEWSTEADDQDTERDQRPFRTYGKRFWVSVTTLRKHLLEVKMDLILSVKLRREERYRDREGKEKERRTVKGKVLLLRADGNIEDSGGRIGTWQAYSDRVATARER